MVAGVGSILVAGFVVLTSPLSDSFFAEGNDTFDDILSLAIAFALLASLVALSVGGIVACCALAKRLGYDPYAGLLLLLPGVNVFVFFMWAFRESPNERRLQRLKAQQNRAESAARFPQPQVARLEEQA